MSNLSVFFNNRVEFSSPPLKTGCDVMAIVWDTNTRCFGDWLFTPIRCLFNGSQVNITEDWKVDHKMIYGNRSNQTKRNLLRIILSIILLVPGLLLGTVFKGISMLSSVQRQKHKFAVLHYTRLPIVKTTIGTEKNPLDLKGIEDAVLKIRSENSLNRLADTIIIYAKPNTEILKDPGYMLSLRPKKIILVGAKLVNGPSHGSAPMWESMGSWFNYSRVSGPITSLADAKNISDKNEKNWTVREAILDKPPRKTFFSLKRYNRLYTIA